MGSIVLFEVVKQELVGLIVDLLLSHEDLLLALLVLDQMLLELVHPNLTLCYLFFSFTSADIFRSIMSSTNSAYYIDS